MDMRPWGKKSVCPIRQRCIILRGSPSILISKVEEPREGGFVHLDLGRGEIKPEEKERER